MWDYIIEQVKPIKRSFIWDTEKKANWAKFYTNIEDIFKLIIQLFHKEYSYITVVKHTFDSFYTVTSSTFTVFLSSTCKVSIAINNLILFRNEF